MFCLRSMRALCQAAAPKTSRVPAKCGIAAQERTFTTRTLIRPSIFPSRVSLQPSTMIPSLDSAQTATTSSRLDLLPKISTHPSLAGIQIRNGPRNTYNPSHRVRKRRHGFLSRKRTRKGRNTLMRRRQKGRSTLSH